MIRDVKCPQCGAASFFNEKQLDKPIRCSQCQTVFVLSSRRVWNETADQPHRKTKAGGAPLGLSGAAVVIELILAIALVGGATYCYLKPAERPRTAVVLPTTPAAGPDAPTPQQPVAPPLPAQRQDKALKPAPQRSVEPRRRVASDRLAQQHVGSGAAPTTSKPQPEGARVPSQKELIAAPRMVKERWRYLVVAVPDDAHAATDQLNELADQGWEYLGLVNTAVPPVSAPGIFDRGHGASVILRRPKIPFKVEGAIEGENLKVIGKSGDFPVVPQDMRGFSLGQWSGDSQLFGKPTQAGAWIDFELPAPADGKYGITAYLTRSWDYGIVQFLVNGIKVGTPIDAFHADNILSTGPIDLGEAELKKGANTVRIEVLGSNPNTRPPHYSWGLDCLELNRLP
jgi:hypothetical protein